MSSCPQAPFVLGKAHHSSLVGKRGEGCGADAPAGKPPPRNSAGPSSSYLLGALGGLFYGSGAAGGKPAAQRPEGRKAQDQAGHKYGGWHGTR